MCFALISFLLAPPLSAQAQTRNAYVAQSADKTTLTFYYDDQRATRTGTTWGIEETKKEGDYTFPAWAGTWKVADSTTTRVVFDASFRDFRPFTTARWFNNYRALKQIEGLEYLNTQKVTDMNGMFYGCSGLTSLDVSHFNTQNVTDMSAMFLECSGLTSLDLSHFNTQNVTDMGAMFSRCSGLTSLDVSHFNTQNVTDMQWMFYYCSGLTSLDVSNFNTQNVTDMQMMFWGCRRLTSLDLSHFNTQNVTDMRAMFCYCSGLPSLDLSHFKTQKVTDMIWMFNGCSALTTINSNTAWECPQSYNMFAGCTQLKGAVPYDQNKTDVTMANPETGYFTRSNDRGVEAYVAQSADKTTLTFYYDDQRATRTDTTWGIEETKKEGNDTFPAWAGTWGVADSTTTRVVFDASFRDFRPTTTAWWFYNYRALKQIEGLEYLKTSEVKDMRGMFSFCSVLTSLDVSHFNTQNVTDMSGMFSFCSVLTSLDVSHFDTQNVTDMAGMFYYCSVLTSLDVSHFNTQNVTDMRWMFEGCWRLTSLDVSHFNTQNVTKMSSMFEGCRRLTSLDVSHFKTQKVTDMSGMFQDCGALTTIKSNTAWQCPQSGGMFAGCTKLKGAVAYDQNKTDATMANPETGYFTRSNDGGVEAYVAQSADKTTLTFYYDDQRATRTGTTWGIEERKEEGNVTFPAWAGTYQVADSLTARVVFDASFRDFRPTTTARWFNNYRALKQIEGLEYLNTQNVTDMRGMFSRCSGLTSLDLSHFNTQNVTDMNGMFSYCSSLTSLDVPHFNTQNVTDMRHMFYYCPSLTSLDLSHFNTQNVTDMGGMFSYCSSLTSLDVPHFNTQNVTDMGGMFFGCSGLTSLDLKNFNTQKVTDMRYMFSGCSGLTSLDVSHFNTQNVTSMQAMFSYCSGLTSLDLSHFNTQNVTNMSYMFYVCSALTTIKSNTAWQCPRSEAMFDGCTKLKGAVPYNGNKTDVTMANPETGYFTRSNDGGVEAYVAQSADKTTLTFYYDDQRATRTGTTWGIKETKKEGDDTFPAWAGTWNVADRVTARVVFDASFRDFRPTTTARWFCNYDALKQIEGLEYLNTSEVKDMSGMFEYCSGLTSLDLSHFNTQNVTDMQSMFFGCSGLTSLDVKNFDTQKVTNMGSMFSGCSGLTSLDVSHFNTQNVTDMSAMFSGCSGLTSLDLKNFNTQNVRVMWAMFSGCSGLTTLDLKNFDTQNVTSMNLMFYGCSGLTSLDVQNFNTQNVTGMNHMFFDCSGLTSLDLKNFDTQNVTNMFGMFSGCSGLTSLDLKNFDTQNVTDMSAMFSGCSSLTSLDLKNFDTQNVTDMSAMFSGCSALTTISSNRAWQCLRSVYMFTGCAQLKGAVAYDENKTDAKMANPETGYFTAKPTAVESVRFGADDAQHIYTLQGKRVRGEWKHLPAGVYVVNGKKTIKP